MTTEVLTSRSPPPLTSSHALLTDFDGTLVEIAAHPDAVAVASGLAGWLHQIEQKLGGALAIVTGRRLASVDALLHPWRYTGAGAHGAEMRLHPDAPLMPVAEPLPDTLMLSITDAIKTWPGVWLENKTYALAVHYRDNPAAEATCRKAVQQALSTETQLQILPGHAVVEVRRRGVSKGVATRFLLQQPHFASRIPVFSGDDLADEEGFAAVQAAGGYGIKIGRGTTVARYRLDSVAQMHAWLRASLDQLRRAA